MSIRDCDRQFRKTPNFDLVGLLPAAQDEEAFLRHRHDALIFKPAFSVKIISFRPVAVASSKPPNLIRNSRHPRTFHASFGSALRMRRSRLEFGDWPTSNLTPSCDIL